MTLTKSMGTDTKKLMDQIQMSIVQIIKATGEGQELVVKVTDGNLTIDRLQPTGHKLTLRMSIDIYPKDNTPG